MKSSEIHSGNWAKLILNHGSWYFFSSVLTKGLGLILIPVYTAYLSPDDYGIIGNLYSISHLLLPLVSLSVDKAFLRFYFDCDDEEQVADLFSTSFWFSVCFGVLISAIVFLSSFAWSKQILQLNPFPLLGLTIVYSLFLQLGNLGYTFLKQTLNSKLVTALQALQSAVMGGTICYLLIIEGLGVQSYVLGFTAGSLAPLLIMSVYAYKNRILRFQFNVKLLKSELVYSIPLIPSVAANWVSGLSDRLILTHIAGLSAAGLYTFAAQVAKILYYFSDSVSQVLTPISLSGLASDRSRTFFKIRLASLSLFYFSIFGCLGLVYFSKEVLQLFAQQRYLEAIPMIPILASMYIIGMQYRFSTIILQFHKKTWHLMTASISSAVVNVILNFIFIPKYGYPAAVMTTVFTVALYGFVLFIFAQQQEKIPYAYKKMCVGVIIMVGLICLQHFIFLPLETSFELLAIKAVLIVSFGGILAALFRTEPRHYKN